MPLYRVYDIVYDIGDCDDGEEPNLPTEMDIFLDVDQSIEYEGADVISDKTGMLVISFKYRLL